MVNPCRDKSELRLRIPTVPAPDFLLLLLLIVFSDVAVAIVLFILVLFFILPIGLRNRGL